MKKKKKRCIFESYFEAKRSWLTRVKKEFEFNQREADMDADKLSKLYDLRLIDENGDPINNSMSK